MQMRMQTDGHQGQYLTEDEIEKDAELLAEYEDTTGEADSAGQ